MNNSLLTFSTIVWGKMRARLPMGDIPDLLLVSNEFIKQEIDSEIFTSTFENTDFQESETLLFAWNCSRTKIKRNLVKYFSISTSKL